MLSMPTSGLSDEADTDRRTEAVDESNDDDYDDDDEQNNARPEEASSPAISPPSC